MNFGGRTIPNMEPTVTVIVPPAEPRLELPQDYLLAHLILRAITAHEWNLSLDLLEICGQLLPSDVRFYACQLCAECGIVRKLACLTPVTANCGCCSPTHNQWNLQQSLAFKFYKLQYDFSCEFNLAVQMLHRLQTTPKTY